MSRFQGEVKMSNDFSGLIPLYSSLLGVALSLIGSWGAIWFSTRSKNKHAAQQLANAFKGEMSALVHIVELRNYADGLKALALWCTQNNSIGFFSAPSREEYRAVYKANVGNLGSLPGDLPKQIAIVDTQMASLLRGYQDMALLKEDTISKAKSTLRILCITHFSAFPT